MADLSKRHGKLLTRGSRWRTGCERGQAFAELALLLPLVVLMLTTVADMGRALRVKQTVAAAAHAGIIYALQGKANAQDQAGIMQKVMTELREFGAETGPVVNVEMGEPEGDGFGEQQFTVTVQLTIPALFQLPGFPASYTVVERASARVLDIKARS